MESATQFISISQTVRSNTGQDFKEFNSQSQETQAKKGEQIISIIPAIETVFDFLDGDIVELST